MKILLLLLSVSLPALAGNGCLGCDGGGAGCSGCHAAVQVDTCAACSGGGMPTDPIIIIVNGEERRVRRSDGGVIHIYKNGTPEGDAALANGGHLSRAIHWGADGKQLPGDHKNQVAAYRKNGGIKGASRKPCILAGIDLTKLPQVPKRQ